LRQFVFEDITSEEVARRTGVYTPLTNSVRELLDATIRTEVDPDTICAAGELIDRATEMLRSAQSDGPHGVRYTADGTGMPWGNPAIGIRNAIAPPMVVKREGDHRRVADVVLGAAYEGPPGLVHGGICALLLDHILGEAASAMTGTLTLRLERATPLGPVHLEAAVTGTDGRKKTVRGSLSDADGITVTAEGIFIMPRTFDDPEGSP
jgi:acyl-coenzyme A thioesterase PaaI-like protein